MKTHLLTKKRALISSVAMLLVAMIALGTATFAWFTQSPNAYAEGFKMQASSSIGLKVLSESHANAKKGGSDVSVEQYAKTASNYVTKTFLRSNSDATGTVNGRFILSPVSFYVNNNNVSAFTTTAAETDNYAKDDAKAIETANASSYASTQGTFYKEKVYATLVGSADPEETKDIKLSVSLDQNGIEATMKDAIIVIVTYHDGTNNTDKVVAKVASKPGDHNAYTKTVPAIDYAGKTSTEEKQAVKNAYDATIAGATGKVNYTSTASNLDAGKVSTNAGQDYFEVYVGLDGMSESVKSINVDASTLLNAVKLDMSIPQE